MQKKLSLQKKLMKKNLSGQKLEKSEQKYHQFHAPSIEQKNKKTKHIK